MFTSNVGKIFFFFKKDKIRLEINHSSCLVLLIFSFHPLLWYGFIYNLFYLLLEPPARAVRPHSMDAGTLRCPPLDCTQYATKRCESINMCGPVN